MGGAAGRGLYNRPPLGSRDGMLPVPARKVGGLILVDEPAPSSAAGMAVVYARVSSADQKSDLDRQVARVTGWGDQPGCRRGPGGDRGRIRAKRGKRRKFLALLRDPAVTMIFVEHRDRFARFGAECVEAALSAQGRKLLVMDPAGVDDDLVRDVTEILTSLCARLYGRRAAANRAQRAVEAATRADS